MANFEHHRMSEGVKKIESSFIVRRGSRNERITLTETADRKGVKHLTMKWPAKGRNETCELKNAAFEERVEPAFITGPPTERGDYRQTIELTYLDGTKVRFENFFGQSSPKGKLKVIGTSTSYAFRRGKGE